MGASGAGKTTLLDVLADRKTTGVIGGSRLVAGRPCGREFQRGTAYVEQQDVHEHTATVREAFRFSAYLRQPADVSKADKDAYVEEVIQLLELEDKADAMIGEVGHGLDVEARKRVTIGVELAAKPQLLLFLDEPTSGASSSRSSLPTLQARAEVLPLQVSTVSRRTTSSASCASSPLRASRFCARSTSPTRFSSRTSTGCSSSSAAARRPTSATSARTRTSCASTSPRTARAAPRTPTPPSVRGLPPRPPSLPSSSH